MEHITKIMCSDMLTIAICMYVNILKDFPLSVN